MSEHYNIEKIESFIYSNFNSVIINDTWGVGKTYELLKLKKKLLEKHKNLQVIYLKISDLEKLSIKEHCYLKSLEKIDENNYIEKIPNFLKIYLKNTKGGVAAVSNHLLDSIYEKNVKKHNLENHLIIIDEIERIQKNIDLRNIFNQIFEIKESNQNVKLILSLNQHELDDDNTELFSKWHDKISDETIKFKYSGKKHFSIEIEKKVLNILGLDFEGNISKLILQSKNENLRRIKYLGEVLFKVSKKIKDNKKNSFFFNKETFYFYIEDLFQTKLEVLDVDFVNIDMFYTPNIFKKEIRFDLAKIDTLYQLKSEATKKDFRPFALKIKEDTLNYAKKNNSFINIFWMSNIYNFETGVKSQSTIEEIIDVNITTSRFLENSFDEKQSYGNYFLSYQDFFDYEYIKKIMIHNKALYFSKLEQINFKTLSLNDFSAILNKYFLYFEHNYSFKNVQNDEVFTYLKENDFIALFEEISNDFFKKFKNLNIEDIQISKDDLERNYIGNVLIYLKLLILSKNKDNAFDIMKNKIYDIILANPDIINKIVEHYEQNTNTNTYDPDILDIDTREAANNAYLKTIESPIKNKSFDWSIELSILCLFKEILKEAKKNHDFYVLEDYKNINYDFFINEAYKNSQIYSDNLEFYINSSFTHDFNKKK